MRMGRPLYDLPLRVTFYARVSTDQDEQINSLEILYGVDSEQTLATEGRPARHPRFAAVTWM